MSHDRSHALDHVVLVLFENRSIDNLLGHLYGPEDGKTFEGVIGKDLSNPIPEWAEHGAERKTVPYTVTTDMDAPNPDSGEDQRLEAHGRTWKIYVQEPSPISGTALVHMPQMKDRLATNILPFSEFEKDAANGTLPHFSMVEPHLLLGHSDYHPAAGRALPGDVEVPLDPPSSILGGEAFLARIYEAIRSAASPEGSNAYNTTFFIGWDEPGGTYDHVPPGPVHRPTRAHPRGRWASNSTAPATVRRRSSPPSAAQIIAFLRTIAFQYFPLLAPGALVSR